MTLDDMVTMTRRRVDDTLSTRWTDAQIILELNAAAVHTGRQVAKHQGWINYPNGTVTITTDGTNKIFATSASSFYKEWKATRIDTDQPEACVRIDERDEAEHSYGDGFDPAGRLYYWVTITSTGTVSIEFPVVHASGIQVKVEYIAAVTELATSGAGSSSYTAVPSQFHELIVSRACLSLMGMDDGKYQFAAGWYQELTQDMIQSLRQKSCSTDVYTGATRR